MQNISKKLLFLTLLFAVVVSQKKLTYTCKTCAASSCKNGFCVTLVGDGYSQSICPSTACSVLDTPVEYYVNNCTVDYMTTSCSTGVCFYLANKPIVLSQTAACQPNTERKYSCAPCVGVPSCASGLCLTPTIKNVAQSQACVTSCPNPAITKITLSSCTQDVIGTVAQGGCCMTFDTTLGAGPVCSTQNTALTSVQTTMSKWVKGSFGSNLIAFLALMLVMAFVL